MARRTQRIPSSQRKRKEIKLTLHPDAYAILKGIAGDASRLVSVLVMAWHRMKTRQARKEGR
jgi:hypothetical protein